MKEKINTILKAVGLMATEIKLDQVTIDEGKATLEAEVFEVGQPVFIVNEDERIPVPVGEYLLDNGFTMIVTEEGVIGEYIEKAVEEPAEEVVEEEVATSEKPNETPIAKKIIEAVTKETHFSAQEKEALENEITELKAQLEAVNKVEVEEVVELSTPIQHNPENFVKPEGFRYGKGAQGKSTLERIYEKLNN